MGLFDRDEKEAEKPDFSNVESGSSSTAPEAREAERTYEVQKGDTLWAIAERFYDDATKWPRIHEANRDRIDNPDVIVPGWELTIPAAGEDETEGEGR